jgi:cellobiose-specific phosphotransferase system component IIA
MTLRELAKTLNQPIGILIRKANQNGFKLGSNSSLTPAQVELLKLTDSTPQLKPASPELEQPKSHDTQDSGQSGELEIKPETAPAAHNSNQSILGVKQQQLSQSVKAQNEQFNHQVHTQLQQSFSDGQELGVLEVLAHEQGRVSAAMALSQVIFETGQKRRANSLATLAEKLESEDFFGEGQSPAESYYKSSQIGASSNLELSQIMRNLASD